MTSKASEAFASTKERTQRENKAKAQRLMGFFGEDREVSTLGADEVRAYTRARMSGKYGPSGRPVRARTVDADLSALRAALNWALGEQHIERNPLAGVSLPREKNPRRPVAAEERYRATLKKAPEVSPSLRPMLVLANDTAGG